MNKIIDRILRDLGCPELLERLMRLPGADLNSLLLAALKQQASKQDAKSLVRAQASNAYTRPIPLDAVHYHQLEAALLGLLQQAGLEPVLLSPAAPLGSCSGFGFVSQDKVVSATRGLELLADPCNALALILADRMRTASSSAQMGMHLCTTARVLRAQPLAGKTSTAHFGLLCMVSGGRDSGSYGCEQALLKRQFAVLTLLLKDRQDQAVLTLRPRPGYPDGPGFFRSMLAFIRELMPSLQVEADPAGADNPYYRGPNFKLHLQQGNERMEIGDGGFVDWLNQASGSRKERCLISGLSLDRLLMLEERTK